MVTSWPSESRHLARYVPTNPVPPVMNIFMSHTTFYFTSPWESTPILLLLFKYSLYFMISAFAFEVTVYG
jgi:hypothetical protein